MNIYQHQYCPVCDIKTDHIIFTVGDKKKSRCLNCLAIYWLDKPELEEIVAIRQVG